MNLNKFEFEVVKLFFRCPKIWTYYNLLLMYLNTGTHKNINFPFGTNGKLMVLGVPILSHFRVEAENNTKHSLRKLYFHHL